jgi:hypothetical protein
MISKEQLLNYLYYKRLPDIYRTQDASHGYVFKKYLEAVIENGYDYIIQNSNSFVDLNDPEKCPDEIFPYLYESKGLIYQPSILMKYQRKILKNLGELNRRRGTYNCVKYLAKVLANTDVELTLQRDMVNGKEVKTLNVLLQASNLEQIQNMDNNIFVIQNYIGDWIPYNVIPHITAQIRTQNVNSYESIGNGISMSLTYDLTN